MPDSDDRVIVVGSGPAGAAAATRLASRGLGVVMLDAGLRAPRGLLARVGGRTVYRRKGWREYSEHRHDPDSHVAWTSSLSHGGLSNYWTAAVPRYAPNDFLEGGRLDERFVWPVTYDDVEPYYEMMEAALRVTSGSAIPGVPAGVNQFTQHLPADWTSIAEAAVAHGYGVGVLPMARGKPSMVARRGTEFSSYQCMVAPALSASFELMSGAMVTTLDWSSSGRVESVTYVDRRTGERHRLRGRAVVVAAGAIDSTAILLRSRSDDFPNGLGNTAGLVGRYLHDHPRQWWTFTTSRSLTAIFQAVYVARADYAESDPLMAHSITIGLTDSVRDRLRTFSGAATSRFGAQVLGTMVPSTDVGVSIGDWEGSRPRISLRYDDRTVENMVEARSRIRDVLAPGGVQVDVPGPFLPLVPGSSVHFGGTVRMHADPAFGVLDGRNRMYDVPNVAVVDSSCFTTGPEKNPTLTSMALAARAADKLADELMSGALC